MNFKQLWLRDREEEIVAYKSSIRANNSIGWNLPWEIGVAGWEQLRDKKWEGGRWV